MRILSLDFDGVLHPSPDVVSKLAHWCWLPHLTRLLAAHPDVRIVVHSTWRDAYCVEELKELLGPLGERVIDATPPGGRLESIERWLELHPDVTSHRILDDDESEFFYPPPAELILCDPNHGISGPQPQKLLTAWLNETRPS